MEQWTDSLSNLDIKYLDVFIGMSRIVIPVLILILLIRCAKPLLRFRQEPEIWAWLCLPNGRKLSITHWENVIGRSKRSDVVIDFPTVSRNHAVLTRYDDGSWTISDAGSKDGVWVNGRRITILPLQPEDVISIGGVEMTLQPITKRQVARLIQLRTKAGSLWRTVINLVLLTLIQCMICFGFVLAGHGENPGSYQIGFGGIIILEWVLFIFYSLIHRVSFEVETIAFFLSTMGMAAIATVCPGEAVKQLIAICLGVATFLGLGWSLRDLERANKFRYLAVIAGIGFLVLTLVLGKELHGAKNWIVIGSYSFQPSELSKICFVYAGASTMDRIMTRRNLILFIVYSVLICGLLALMNDFGTALIFFCAFLVIAYLRSGSVGTLGLACTALGFAGVLAVKIAPHAMRRFTSWRHIWEDPLNKGFQQTRALMCIASGGLLGLGAGQGRMKYVFAADSDMVFATISEEWGLFVALMMVLCIVVLAMFSIRSSGVARSSFYTIGGCTAGSILVIQTILNALGTVDIVPLTGVTFPFVANGGSSMICTWGLLAFIKAADTRMGGSFAVRQLKGGGEPNE